MKQSLQLCFLFCLIFSSSSFARQIVSILGTGYVGLVSAVCFAEIHNANDFLFVGLDINSHKINQLNNGIIPIYEQELETLVHKATSEGKLIFSDDIANWITQSNIIFIAVGTPTKEDGSVDLGYIYDAIDTIVKHMNDDTTIIIKSTVPIGTSKRINEYIKMHTQKPYQLATNPEFLREGTAIYDFLNPDRIVCGIQNNGDIKILEKLYAPLIAKNIPFISTDFATSETIKYASNCFLALKLSYINEIANLCEKTGADIKTVSYGVGLDHRINHYFLNPGPGYGGSCLPKDTMGLLHTAHILGNPLYTIDAAHRANKDQKLVPYKKLKRLLHNDLKHKTVALLGLSFKANTDDIRYAASISIIKKLISKECIIKVYDPEAMNNMKLLFPHIIYCSSAYEAIADSDAVLLLTEWQEFYALDLDTISTIMKGTIIIDARNILTHCITKKSNILYENIGYQLPEDAYVCLQ